MISGETGSTFKLRRRERASVYWRVFAWLMLAGLLANIYAALTRPVNVQQLLGIGEISFVLILLAGNKFLRWRLSRPRVRARIIRKIEDAARADLREPVLYLRDFGQDATLSAVEAVDVGLMPSLRPMTIEQNLQIALSFVGPVFALRDPGDRSNNLIPPPGVCRFWAGEDWKSDVRERMLKASVVALLPGATFDGAGGAEKGFVWEIRELARLGLLNKTLIFIPQGKDYYHSFRAEMRARGIFPALPEFVEPRVFRHRGPIRAVIYFNEAHSPLLHVITTPGSKAAFWTTVIPYLGRTFDRTGKQWRKRRRNRTLKNIVRDFAAFGGMVATGILIAVVCQLMAAGST